MCCAVLCHVVPCCQVLLQPDGAGVRLPARLLALYSSLFDDLFQSMLEDEDQELGHQQPAAAAGVGGRGVQQRPVHVVPVPGVGQDSIAAVCRWMMGLLALRSCTVATLVDMYRCVDYHQIFCSGSGSVPVFSSHPVCSYPSRSEPEQTELKVACRLAPLQQPCIGVHVHVSLTGIPHGWCFDALLCVPYRPLSLPQGC
jgi:hypothetical protein